MNLFSLSSSSCQDITTTSNSGEVTTNVHWTGTMSDNLVTFDGGYQMTLLPGGMYMGCPSNVAKNVAESKSFHLEFCWLEGPGRRQRLVRTYDMEGLAVSSTYFLETKSWGWEKDWFLVNCKTRRAYLYWLSRAKWGLRSSKTWKQGFCLAVRIMTNEM